MKHFVVIISNRVLGYIFNLILIPYCVILEMSEFVRFYIIALVAKTFFDSAAVFYPLQEKFNSVSPSKFLSVIVQYRSLMAILLVIVSLLLSFEIYLSLLFIISCIVNMEFYFNLENDSKNLFIQSNLSKLLLTVCLFTFNTSDTVLILVYVLLSLFISILGYAKYSRIISWKLNFSYFFEFKKLFYLTVPAILNYGSRELGTYIMYDHLGKDFVFSDRVQKSVLSVTAAFGPFSAAFPDRIFQLFNRFKYLVLFVLPLLMSFFFLIYVSLANKFQISTILFSVSLYLGSVNYLIQLFYFNLKGRFKEVYFLNILYGFIGLFLIFTCDHYSLFERFPFVMLIQELSLLIGMLLFSQKVFCKDLQV